MTNPVSSLSRHKVRSAGTNGLTDVVWEGQPDAPECEAVPITKRGPTPAPRGEIPGHLGGAFVIEKRSVKNRPPLCHFPSGSQHPPPMKTWQQPDQ